MTTIHTAKVCLHTKQEVRELAALLASTLNAPAMAKGILGTLPQRWLYQLDEDGRTPKKVRPVSDEEAAELFKAWQESIGIPPEDVAQLALEAEAEAEADAEDTDEPDDDDAPKAKKKSKAPLKLKKRPTPDQERQRPRFSSIPNHKPFVANHNGATLKVVDLGGNFWSVSVTAPKGEWAENTAFWPIIKRVAAWA